MAQHQPLQRITSVEMVSENHLPPPLYGRPKEKKTAWLKLTGRSSYSHIVVMFIW